MHLSKVSAGILGAEMNNKEQIPLPSLWCEFVQQEHCSKEHKYDSNPPLYSSAVWMHKDTMGRGLVLVVARRVWKRMTRILALACSNRHNSSMHLIHSLVRRCIHDQRRVPGKLS